MQYNAVRMSGGPLLQVKLAQLLKLRDTSQRARQVGATLHKCTASQSTAWGAWSAGPVAGAHLCGMAVVAPADSHGLILQQVLHSASGLPVELHICHLQQRGKGAARAKGTARASACGQPCQTYVYQVQQLPSIKL